MIDYPLRAHKIVELDMSTGEHVIACKLTEGPFEGLVFSVSHVEFQGTMEKPVLKFDYILHVDIDDESKHEAIRNEIGDFIMGSIQRDMKNNDVVMGGKHDSADDIQESNDERVVFEEGESLP